MEKTIKEFSEEIDFSKQRIQQIIDKLPTNRRPKKSGNKYVLSEEIQREIKILLGIESTNSSPNNQQIEVGVFELLKQQLEEKDRQIKNLQDTLNEQQTLLSQQQQLQLMEQQKMHLLLDEAKQESEKTDNKNFFSRLFNK
ncbi:MAG: hypothetical protein WBF67_03605 [Olleya sp.]